MRSPTAPASRRAVRGLSMIELMVSLTIGLILMVAVVSGYLGSATASRMAEAQGRMNEDAQAALAILTQHLRMAGNNPKQPLYSSATPTNPVFGSPAFYIRGCDAKFGNVTSAANLAALTCTAGTGPDSVAVVYEADTHNTVKGSTNKPTDCLGQELTATTGTVSKWDGATTGGIPVGPVLDSTANNVSFYTADNRFYIDTLSGSPNLYCKGSGNATAQPLVENIEDIQITYGVAKSTGATMDVLGYLSAEEIRTDAALSLLPDDATRWSRVMTVRICVIARSESPVAPSAESAQFYDCTPYGGTLTSKGDLYLRHAYTTTVVLRNRPLPS